MINPGEKACCNWENSDCNKNGKKDSIVKFDVIYDYKAIIGGKDYGKVICRDFAIKAGGWLTVEGSGGNYTCTAHY